MAFDKAYYEYLILTKHQGCLEDVKRIRKNHNFKPFKDREEAMAWTIQQDKKRGKLRSLFSIIWDDSREIVKKYQPKHATNTKHIDMFNWFVLTNKEVYLNSIPVSICPFILREPRKDEHIFVYIKKGATKQDYLSVWEDIEEYLGELGDNEFIKNSKRGEPDFDVKLSLYKCYLRAKHQKKSTSIYDWLWRLSSEVEEILKDQNAKKYKTMQSLSRMINNFHNDYGSLDIMSKKELEKPIT